MIVFQTYLNMAFLLAKVILWVVQVLALSFLNTMVEEYVVQLYAYVVRCTLYVVRCTLYVVCTNTTNKKPFKLWYFIYVFFIFSCCSGRPGPTHHNGVGGPSLSSFFTFFGGQSNILLPSLAIFLKNKITRALTFSQ